MKTYIDTKSKKVYNEGDLYTVVKETKKEGFYSKEVKTFRINDETIKLTEGRLVKQPSQECDANRPCSNCLEAKIKQLGIDLLKYIDKTKQYKLFMRMCNICPISFVQYLNRELALAVEHEMGYKGHIKNYKGDLFRVVYDIAPDKTCTYKVGIHTGKVNCIVYSYFRERRIAEYVGETVCEILKLFKETTDEQENKKRQ